MAARAGDPDRASRLAADAEALASTITNLDIQARVLAELASLAIQAGHPDRAEALARTIADPDTQAGALIKLAAAAAQAGDPQRVRHLLALTLIGEAPDIRLWIGTVSRFYPSVIKDAGDALLSKYKTGT